MNLFFSILGTQIDLFGGVSIFEVIVASDRAARLAYLKTRIEVTTGRRRSLSFQTWIYSTSVFMPRGTRPSRTLLLYIRTMGGQQFELALSSSKTVRDLRRAVKKLTKEEGPFDLVHLDRPDITFGVSDQRGTEEYERDTSRKLCNLRVRTGDAIFLMRCPPTLDSDGDPIPYLLGDSSSSDEENIAVWHGRWASSFFEFRQPPIMLSDDVGYFTVYEGDVCPYEAID